MPSATEILFGIGAGDDVVAVTHECDYPSQALRLPRVTSSSGPELSDPAAIDRHVRAALHAGSSLYQLDTDLLDHLEPDLIVTQELCPVCAVSYEIVASAAKRLRSDPRVVSLEPSSLDDVLANIAFVGEVTDRADSAREVIGALRLRIEALRERDKVPLRTLVLEWTDPPMSAGHWIPELIELAGGEADFGDPGQSSQRLDWSAIAAADPEAIVVAPCGFDLSATNRAIALLDSVKEWKALTASRSGRVLRYGRQRLYEPARTPANRLRRKLIAQWYTTVAEYAG